MKSTSRPPPQTFEEIKNDIDLGLDFGLEPPKLYLPNQVDPLYVEKPIGDYEPQFAGTGAKNRLRKGIEGKEGEQRIIKKKWKPEPTTQAE